MTFVLAAQTRALLRAHAWPGNVRELELLTRSATVFALADAVHAVDQGRTGGSGVARALPIPAKLVRDLLAGANPGAPAGHREVAVSLSPAPTLHKLAREVERQIYARLFAETAGDFTEMARRLLGVATAAAARRVRLRFNQLGLRARRR